MEQHTIKLEGLEFAFEQLNWVDANPNLPVQITNVVIPPYPSKVYAINPGEEQVPERDDAKLETLDVLAFDVVGKYINTPRNITMYINMENAQFISFLDLITKQLELNNTISESIFSNLNWGGFTFNAPSFRISTNVWILGFIHLGYYMEVDTIMGTKKYAKLKIDLVESINPQILKIDKPAGLP